MEDNQHLERPVYKDLLYGSCAGIIAKCFEHPFDLVKVRLQSQPWVNDRPQRYQGPLDCFVKVFRSEGVRGLYRGLSMPIVGAMAENATLFVVYNQVQRLLARVDPYDTAKTPTPIPHLAVAGAAAGACVSYVLTPIELVKCRMQVQMISPTRPFRLPGPFSVARQIVGESRMAGLWLGQTGTLLRETGGSIAWFLMYELVVRQTLAERHPSGSTKADLSVIESMIAGASAGIGYTVVLFPADTIKSTIQTAKELEGPSSIPRGFIETGRKIYTSKGVKGLYSGCGLTCLRSAPSSALIFSVYAFLTSKFG